MAVRYLGEDPKHFQEIMGRGGVIGSRNRQVKQDVEPAPETIKTGGENGLISKQGNEAGRSSQDNGPERGIDCDALREITTARN